MRTGARVGWAAGAAALLLGLAGALRAAPPAEAPDASALGRAMLARCAAIRALNARLSARVSWQGEAMTSTVRLAFARSAAAGSKAKPRLRLDMKVQNAVL